MNQTFSFLAPASLVLFVYSGMFKWIPFPIDPTIIFGSLVGLFIVLYLCNQGNRTTRIAANATFLVLIFLIFYFVTALYTVSPNYWREKATLLVLDMLAFLGGYIILKDEKSFNRAQQCLTIFAGTALAILIFFYITGTLDLFVTKRYAEISEKLPDYLGVGVLLGIGTLIFLQIGHWYGVALAITSVFLIFQLGARGPIVVLAIMLLTYVLSGQIFRIRKVTAFMLLMAVLSFIPFSSLVFESLSSSNLYYRLAGIFVSDYSFAQAFRTREFSIALSVFGEFPFLGSGIGGYGISGWHVDADYYPHNIFLEVLAETGIFGAAIFLLGPLYIFAHAYRFRSDPRVRWATILFVFIALNYMKSGGFIGARDIYFFLGMLVATQDMYQMKRNQSVPYL